MTTTPMPGHVTVTPDAVYARYPDLDKKITAHLQAWLDAVPDGYTCTVDAMINAGRTFGDPGHGMPLEIVMAHLAAGVDGLTVDTANAPWLLTKTGA